MTVRVDADLPIDAHTFAAEVRAVRDRRAGARRRRPERRPPHHPPPLRAPRPEGKDLGELVYRKPPWAIYRKGSSWIYLGISPTEGDDVHPPRGRVQRRPHARAHLQRRDAHRRAGATAASPRSPCSPPTRSCSRACSPTAAGCYLHSGGVVLDGKGLLFVGHSEAGKSTTMKLLDGRRRGALRRPQHRAPRARRRLSRVRHLEPRRGAHRLRGQRAAGRPSSSCARATENRIDPLDDRAAVRRGAAGHDHQAVRHRRLVGEVAGHDRAHRQRGARATRCASTRAGRSCRDRGAGRGAARPRQRRERLRHRRRAPPASTHLWREHGRPALGRLDIELTERCDNDCMHCCICLPERRRGGAAAGDEHGRGAGRAHEAAALGALSVRFTGGEPLLRDDFEELYLFARRLGLKVMLFTNARGVTPELADLLARVPPLELVEVSVYGMSAAHATRRVARRRGLVRGVPPRRRAAARPRRAASWSRARCCPDWPARSPSSRRGRRPCRPWTSRPATRCSSTCAGGGLRRLRRGRPRARVHRAASRLRLRAPQRDDPPRAPLAGRGRALPHPRPRALPRRACASSAASSCARPATRCSRAAPGMAPAWTPTARCRPACRCARPDTVVSLRCGRRGRGGRRGPAATSP